MIRQLPRAAVRTMFVVPSRTAQASTASMSAGSSTWAASSLASMPAACSAMRAPSSSLASVGWR